MFKLIKELFSLLTIAQRKRFYILQVLVVIMTISEIVGVVSIIPFMALVGDMGVLEKENSLSSIYEISGLNPSQFVILLGVGVLLALLLSTLVSMVTTWRLSMFATQAGSEVADRLYSHYLRQNWLFHASGSSAQLTKKIANETTRVTNQILQPLMQMNARLVLSFFMSLGILIYDPKVAIIGLTIFSISYLILYKLVRKTLYRNGQSISTVYEERFRLMNEGFGGIKDVLLLGRDEDFITRFKKTGEGFARSQGVNSALAQVPRYFMELIAFGGMISLVLYLVATHHGQLGAILPIMSVYALATFKLLPAFQQLYNSIARIKGNISAFESIKEDLLASNEGGDTLVETRNVIQESITPRADIRLKGIKFSYPDKTTPAINGLDLLIKANNVIGIVGSSGSGKSTIIDILLGLISPDKGTLKVDATVINSGNLRLWQNTIGFVPQSIFLSEGSIAQNVAFGVSEKEINIAQVKQALNLARLDELVDTLELGMDTKVGERGVQLSGGQRQRIGIARALYHQADVLVFDEATSALDGITEKMIMDAIHDFNGTKTIIMVAHRLKTVKECDQIFFIDKGRLIDQGTYQYLIENNKRFKAMAEHA